MTTKRDERRVSPREVPFCLPNEAFCIMAEIQGRLPPNLPTNELKSAILLSDNCNQFPHPLLPAKGPTTMTIAFSCPECDNTFKCSDDIAGRKGKCTNCVAT